MFNLFEDVWKCQNYLANAHQFVIPDSIFLDGPQVRWFFSSRSPKHPRKILKKKPEHSTVQHLVKFFQIEEPFDDLSKSPQMYKFQDEHYESEYPQVVFSRKVTSDNQSTVLIKHLNRKELALLLFDYGKYPQLYKEVLIYKEPLIDAEFGPHYIETCVKENIYNIEVKQLSMKLPFEVHQAYICQKLNDFKEKRLINTVQQMMNGLEIVYSVLGRIREINLSFCQQDNQMVLLWCRSVRWCSMDSRKATSNESFSFKVAENFLYNQQSYDRYKRQEIQLEFEKERKQKEKKIQCASCLQIILKGDSSKVTGGRLWQIRMSRGLHQLNKDKVKLQQGLIRSKEEYSFVDICSMCYQAYLKLITKSDWKRPQSHNRSIPQVVNLENRHPNLSLNISVESNSNNETVQKTLHQTSPLSKDLPKTSIQQQQQQQQISVTNDFDSLLLQLLGEESGQATFTHPQSEDIVIKEPIVQLKPPLPASLPASIVKPKPPHPRIEIPQCPMDNISHSQATQETEHQRKQIQFIQKNTGSQHTVKDAPSQRKYQIRSFSAQTRKGKRRAEVVDNLDSIVNSQFNSLICQIDDID